jgi:hypothetical protein
VNSDIITSQLSQKRCSSGVIVQQLIVVVEVEIGEIFEVGIARLIIGEIFSIVETLKLV